MNRPGRPPGPKALGQISYLSVRLPRDLHEDALMIAAQKSVSMNQLFVDAIASHLRNLLEPSNESSR